MQLELVYLLGTYSNYTKYNTILDKLHITNETYVLLTAIQEYYKRGEPKDIDWTAFKTWYTTIYGAKFDTTTLELAELAINRLIKDDVDKIIAKELLEILIKKTIGEKLVVYAYDVAEGTSSDLSPIWDLKDTYDSLMSDVEEKPEDPKAKLIEALTEVTGLAGGGIPGG